MKSTSNIPSFNKPARRTGSFTPAFPILALYDPVVRLMSRDRAWRSALLLHLQPRENEVIVDVGCGTGSFLREIGRNAPGAHLIGVDPDEQVLLRTQHKLVAAKIKAELYCGRSPDLIEILQGREVYKITSSLVFHQMPPVEKSAALAAMFAVLSPKGTVAIADYGLQRTVVMRALFKLVQYVDGFEDTQPNAEGILPELMRDAGFIHVEEINVFATATGSISIYRGVKPSSG